MGNKIVQRKTLKLKNIDEENHNDDPEENENDDPEENENDNNAEMERKMEEMGLNKAEIISKIKYNMIMGWFSLTMILEGYGQMMMSVFVLTIGNADNYNWEGAKYVFYQSLAQS